MIFCINFLGKTNSIGDIKLKKTKLLILISFFIVGVSLPSCKKTTENTKAEKMSDKTQHKFTNRLINETSPYLLQHAHNPVNWFPWGQDAMQKAKDENKPILVSIGYSSCHWCHVMERESFEDTAIAKIMNDKFVSIKVDREERPDVDQIYMNAVQAMTGSGGWPLNVFLTPEGEPFYGGTYFPPKRMYGRPSWADVLTSISKHWEESPETAKEQAKKLTQHIQQIGNYSGQTADLSSSLLDSAFANALTNFDKTYGGFGNPPKFLHTMEMMTLLRFYTRSKNQKALEMVEFTLRKMAEGGIYDHIGGGFSRYSTDAKWLVPHFEKMLYDNALLSRVYLETYQVTKNEFYKKIAEEIFTYILRDMTSEKGGFFSAEDADSEGEEGKFYVWTTAEIEAILGKEDAKIFNEFFNVSESGNFENKNILNIKISLEDFAKQKSMSVSDFKKFVTEAKTKLFVEREKRVRPGLDDKILVSWNAMMLYSFIQGYNILRNETYLEAATKNADFLLENLANGKFLYRTHKDGKSHLNAYLQDYSKFGLALVELFSATGEKKYLERAEDFAETMIQEFWDEKDKAFYLTGKNHEKLIVRSKDIYDGAVPSGNSVALDFLLRLHVLTGNERFREIGMKGLENIAEIAGKYSSSFGYILMTSDFAIDSPKEIVIIGEDNEEFLAKLYADFYPNKVVVLANEGSEELGKEIPLLEGRTKIGNKTTAFVCKNFVCKLPVTEVSDFVKQLNSIF